MTLSLQAELDAFLCEVAHGFYRDALATLEQIRRDYPTELSCYLDNVANKIRSERTTTP